MAAKKASNKTKPTKQTPADFIKAVEHPVRQADAKFLLTWFAEVTDMPAVLWGTSIIGYGRYHYEYESGRSGEFMITGFSPRKSALSIYILPGYRDLSAYLKRLGKHKIGKSCLYINKLEDIDIDVLEEIVREGVSYMRQNYQTWDK